MRSFIMMMAILIIGSNLLAGKKEVTHDPVMLWVGDRKITQSEFETVYRKNNLDMEVADPKSVDEYLELYINFNLKVLEAQSLGLDTSQAFLTELKGYREQLARPYFNDPDITGQILEEAYERMQYDIRASHILINLPAEATAEDTLRAYNKAMELRSRALSGESFAELARTYSDDPSARDIPAEDGRPPRKGNAGDLGYFSVFNMVYPFETAAYNTAVGEISKPARSDYGYHIIHVTDRLPAMGTAFVSHIMVMTPADADEKMLKEAEDKIRSIYELHQNGEPFEDLAKQYSEDRNSAANNGQLQRFTSSRMVPEFIKTISQLTRKDEVSQPVKSQFGWHIIKLYEKTPPGSLDDEMAFLKTRISRDPRGQLSKKAVVEKLKKEYKLKAYPARIEPFYTMVDSTIFRASWAPQEMPKRNRLLLSFGPEKYYIRDFADYLVEKQAMRAQQDIPSYVDNMFKNFVEDKLLAYEDRQLEMKHPDFKRLMQEYHDGILLFELTDREVWSRAVSDTVGLHEYYHRNKEKYMWDQRLHATVYTFGDAASAEAAMSMIALWTDEGQDEESIAASLQSEISTFTKSYREKFVKGAHPLIDELNWREGLRGPVQYGNEFWVVYVHEVLDPQPKKINEIRGLLISDFQNYLEKKWVEELRQKYEIRVDEKILQDVRVAVGSTNY